MKGYKLVDDQAQAARFLRDAMPTVDEMLAFDDALWVKVAQSMVIVPGMRRDWRERLARLRALRLAGDPRSAALMTAESRLRTIIDTINANRGDLKEAGAELAARWWLQLQATLPPAAENRPTASRQG